MRAVGYQTSQPIDSAASLVDITLPRPVPGDRDLLVEVRAVSVNPVDTKVRRNAAPEAGSWKVLGWDAAGVVVECGPGASLFKPGDEVFYAGALGRQGSSAEFHLVDERIVARRPRSLDWAESAALPLTSVTAWEALFDRLGIRGHEVPGAASAILVIGGAGGVGSIAIQLARRLTGLTVIATAARPETRDWVAALGAHHVVDHGQPLAPQVAALGIGAPGLVFSTTQSARHWGQVAELIAPQGRFALIDDAAGADIGAFKTRCVSVHWEYMFARPMFETPDMAVQGALLNEVADLVDDGVLRTTLGKRLGPINAATLKQAHRLIESGTARGKLVAEGFATG